VTCEVCFYDAWVPIESEQDCALVHPHSGEHVRCDYCWLKARYMELWGALAVLKTRMSGV
jgi:hypothetical protein